ncbi:MAG: polysaccharide deacetylase family protein [Anaerovoracaceae bacterium]
MARKNGTLVISLDFELYWGVRDNKSIEDYQDNILGGRLAIPKILTLFNRYNIHATWAAVGFLCFEKKAELVTALPQKQPKYVNENLSPYKCIESIGNNEKEDPFHYGYSLLKHILSYEYQEIGTHTFSHYYCLELGQSLEQFNADLQAAKQVFDKNNWQLKSLIFPRNQFNDRYLDVCNSLGIKAYRGNESAWFYSPTSKANESWLRRGIRLLDAYINISGANCYLITNPKSFPVNIPSSRFLRPYNPRLKGLEKWRSQRILSAMTYAAKKGLVYHLWWHPHNFGVNTEENLLFLQNILEHYSDLQKTYNMESLNMGELADIV